MVNEKFIFLFLIYMVALKRAFGYEIHVSSNLLGGSVLGDGLGAFADGVFGQFTRQEESDSGLDLTTGDG